MVVEAIEETGNVLFGLTSKIAARIQADGGPELRYLGQFHFAARPATRCTGRPPRPRGHPLTELERVRCLDLAFRVFDLFTDWTTELLAYAKNSLAHRTVPHVVPARAFRRRADHAASKHSRRQLAAPGTGPGQRWSAQHRGAGDREVLGHAGLEPDLVVGCSSGALFGACIAMGMTGEQGLAAAKQLWSAELTEKKRWSAYLELIAPRSCVSTRIFRCATRG